MAEGGTGDESAPKPGRAVAGKLAQAKRREQALRENLKRRKEQERARKALPKPRG